MDPPFVFTHKYPHAYGCTQAYPGHTGARIPTTRFAHTDTAAVHRWMDEACNGGACESEYATVRGSEREGEAALRLPL